MSERQIRLVRGGPEPLYAQLRDALRESIQRETLPAGSALPGEFELMGTYGVSRSVVRQALGELATEGLLVRHRGRGTVVAPGRQHHRLVTRAGDLPRQMEAAGAVVRTVLHRITTEPPPDAALPALGTDRAWCIERSRLVDDEPVVYMRTWVPRALFPDLDELTLGEGSLLDFMRASGIRPVGGPRQVQAVPAEATVARRLGVTPGTPVLLLRAITQDDTGRCLEWATVWHQPSTVFDVEARVLEDTAPGVDAPFTGVKAGAFDRDRARHLVEELSRLLESDDPGL